MNRTNVSRETLAAQGLGWVDKNKRSIIPPIYPSTTFERNSDLSYFEGRSYSRAANPTYIQVSELLSQ
ncbi:cystathionine gamma-synthase, partial [candidate division KSB1 bacterium]